MWLSSALFDLIEQLVSQLVVFKHIGQTSVIEELVWRTVDKTYKSLYGNQEMAFKSFNIWKIYRIKTLEHSMLPFFLILESLNEILASFDIFALQCHHKRQDRKLRPLRRQNTLQERVK